MNNLVIPVWLLALAFAAFVGLLGLSYVEGRTFKVFGEDFGFEGKPTLIATDIKGVVLTRGVDWKQGDKPKSLGVPSDQGICFLTRVTGAFAGRDEVVRVSVREGTYYLEGASQQDGVAASARCIMFPRTSITEQSASN